MPVQEVRNPQPRKAPKRLDKDRQSHQVRYKPRNDYQDPRGNEGQKIGVFAAWVASRSQLLSQTQKASTGGAQHKGNRKKSRHARYCYGKIDAETTGKPRNQEGVGEHKKGEK